MSKDELIEWIKERHMMSLPKYSDVLFCRWKIQSRKYLVSLDLLNAEFERIRRIQDPVAHWSAFKKYQQRSESSRLEDLRIRRLYKSIDDARKAEGAVCP